jgi:16S rRNA (adenine1518-N6/adenine1519-N6)-dimethyltransferase
MKPKKSLGQNFLIEPTIVQKIIFAANIKGGGETSAFAGGLASGRSLETVLEVGPGKGILTRALLDAGAKVIAVEKDDALAKNLEIIFAKEISEEKLILVHDDILKFFESQRFDLLDAQGRTSNSGFSVVANIPYNITGELIRKLLEGEHQPQAMTLMVQKEVAQRIVASDSKESLLSLSVKAFGTPEYVATVTRDNFYPAPNVDSAILRISDISNDFIKTLQLSDMWKTVWKTSEQAFFGLLHAGFAHKRKMLVSNLAAIASKNEIMAVFKAFKINEKARAEELSLSDWRCLLSPIS